MQNTRNEHTVLYVHVLGYRDTHNMHLHVCHIHVLCLHQLLQSLHHQCHKEKVLATVALLCVPYMCVPASMALPYTCSSNTSKLSLCTASILHMYLCGQNFKHTTVG